MNRVQSPDTSDLGVENRLQLLGKTAPRVTPEYIKDQIDSVYYFNGLDAVYSTYPPNITEVAATSLPLVTFCVIVCKNGFKAVGTSACISAENFDAKIGQELAYKQAFDKLWEPMGYHHMVMLSQTNSGQGAD